MNIIKKILMNIKKENMGNVYIHYNICQQQLRSVA
jgi:hypothetical protein